MLIAGGVLDILPLSGVVLPFLSYGRTALVTNFAIFGMLMAIAREGGSSDDTEPFRSTHARRRNRCRRVRSAVLVAKAAYVQMLRADPTLGRGALTMQADGCSAIPVQPAIARHRARRFRAGPSTIATDCRSLRATGRRSPRIAMHTRRPVSHCPRMRPSADDTRFYPLGARTVHLLGDLRTRANWGARNSSYAERDFSVALQGYDDRATVVAVPRSTGPASRRYSVRYDFRELVPLLRHQYEPNNPQVRRIRDRDRSLRHVDRCAFASPCRRPAG